MKNEFIDNMYKLTEEILLDLNRDDYITAKARALQLVNRLDIIMNFEEEDDA